MKETKKRKVLYLNDFYLNHQTPIHVRPLYKEQKGFIAFQNGIFMISLYSWAKCNVDILRPKINIQTHTSQFSIGCLNVNCINEAEIRQRK